MDYSKELPYHNQNFDDSEANSPEERESAAFYFNHFGGYTPNLDTYNNMLKKIPIEYKPATMDELADLESEAEELF